MTTNELISTIFQVVILPLLTVLTGYAVKWVNAKAKELKATTDNVYTHKYIEMLQDTIVKTVIAVNQTYVDTLKQQGSFDKAAQEEAFKRVYETVLLSLNEEAYEYLNNIFGDLQTYITAQIEAAVKEHKIMVKPE